HGGIELAGKTLGVLGFGRIGQQVARRAVGLGMHVVAYDPFVSAERFRELGIERLETTADVYAAAEFLTLHLPLTPETRGSLDEAQDRAGVIVAEQVAAALDGGLVTNAVNIPVIGAEELEALGPYVPLAAKLGRLAMELTEGRADEIVLTSYGGLADYDTRLLTVSALNRAFQGRAGRARPRGHAVRRSGREHRQHDRVTHTPWRQSADGAVGRLDAAARPRGAHPGGRLRRRACPRARSGHVAPSLGRCPLSPRET